MNSYKGYNYDDSSFNKTKEVVNSLLKYQKRDVRRLDNILSFASGCSVELILLDQFGLLTTTKFFGSVNSKGEVVDVDGNFGIQVDDFGVYKVFFYGSGMDVLEQESGNVIPYTEIFYANTTSTPGGSDVMFKSVYDTNSNNRVDVAESVVIDILATENIIKYNVVTTDGKVADSLNLTHAHKIGGIAIMDANIGFICKVQTFGLLVEPTWTWSGSYIFLDGTVLSQTFPSTGFNINLGRIKSSTEIFVDLKYSILL